MPPLETKAHYPLGVAPTFTRPPVARVAAESAAEAALRAVSAELTTLRAEGRVVLRLPLGVVDDGWLIRDRLSADPADLAELTASLRAHGQRTPIEVAELGVARYGLISGGRRMAALRGLAQDDAAFGTVLALVRSPATSADAYVAMVEENEIRVGLSYWERARVVVRAVAGGVFATDRQALQQLFASASRAKRSKIGSFVALVAALDGVLRFPAALPERAGLRLAQALATDPGVAGRLAQALAADPPADAGAEQARIARVLAPARQPAPKADPKSGASSGASSGPQPVAPGLWLDAAPGRVVLGGPAVDDAFRARLRAWAAADLGSAAKTQAD